ncbi:hypothetical protein [Sphingobacterium zeae]|uniref:Uncharacterized protein n=1 Tax=Sphingobacterium zeae TaxID=1776859 RepID=A0ABU0U9V4_9SPHI|nr:hypothetical protein [Sphingobacterium zeae]MDQ1151641.1 hypothetical protein [Sphingobacterium zeae]
MRKKLYFTFFSLLSLTYSCQKDKTSNQETNQIIQEFTQDNYHTFAKSLAKIIDNKEIKAALKAKALEKFDGDYDVLVKDFVLVKLKDGNSVLDLLTEQNEEIRSIIANNPLLTIYVPELTIFSANNWDTEKTTPIIAIRNNKGGNKIYAYNTRLNIIELDKKIEPTIPTILVKSNERLPFIDNESVQIVNSKPFSKIASDRTGSDRSKDMGFAPRIEEAISKGLPLSNIRDYVYYGLDPKNNILKGELNSQNYAEHIRAIELTSKAVLDKIADWGEGDLEIKITVNIPQRDGTPLQISKAIFCKKTDLYQEPTSRKEGFVRLFVGFDPIQIATWDNYNLGNLWTFHAEEFDEGEERTSTETIENTFTKEGGGSFEVTLKEIFKIGLSGKVSEVERKTTTFTMKSTNNSDNLYGAILNYLEPIAIADGTGNYNPYYLNTGAIKIRVEPYPTGGIPPTNTGGTRPR